MTVFWTLLTGITAGILIWCIAHKVMNSLPATEAFQPLIEHRIPQDIRYIPGIALTVMLTCGLTILSSSRINGPDALIFYMAFFLTLILIVIIDIYRQLILNKVLVFLLLFGIFLNLFTQSIEWSDALFGMLSGGLSMYFLAIMGSYAFGKPALGMGDVKMMTVAGFFLGFEYTIFSLFLTFWVALLLTMPMLLMRKKVQILPLAPAMALTFTLMILFGKPITDFYWHYLIGTM